MDLYYKQEITVGLLVIVAIAGFFGGLMWLTGRSFNTGRMDVHAMFEEIGTLTEGDPVQISGYIVGTVAAIELQGQGQVNLTLEVDGRFRPKVDAEVAIRSLDFLGAKYVEYSPGNASSFLDEDEVLTGTSSVDFAEVATNITDEAVEVLIGAQRILSERMTEDLHSTLAAVREALTVVSRVADGPLIDEARGSFRALERVASRLDTTLANPAITESISQLDELTENVTEMAQGFAGAAMALSTMLERMSDTTGSIGKLLADTTIHSDLHELLVSLRKLLDDIRDNPGRYTFVSVF
jgi:phospholipid/cholesterol/gamma-HCH transport system substrate-binding protein